MSFTRHYIDQSQPAAASGLSGNVFERIFKIGSTLWGAFVDYNGPGHFLLYKSTAAGLVSPWTLLDTLPLPATDTAGAPWFYTTVLYLNKIYVIAAFRNSSTGTTNELDLYWTNSDPTASTPTWAPWSASAICNGPSERQL